MYLEIEEKTGRIKCPKCGGKATLKSIYSDMFPIGVKFAQTLKSYC